MNTVAKASPYDISTLRNAPLPSPLAKASPLASQFHNMGSDDRSEIAFFDVETTVPTRSGQRHAILEFGAILVCPRKLEELRSYSTLVRPANPSLITSLSVRCNGITPDAVVSAPSFSDIADVVYDILHGRIWAGHNIIRFDCARIKESFRDIGRDPPEPKGLIDSLALLTQKFGRRAGDMKMASLATYFGLGKQKHRSLDDVRLNLEVVKMCATVLFLESSLPDIFTEKSWVSPNATTRSRSNGKSPAEGMGLNTDTPSSSSKILNNISVPSPPDHMDEGQHPIVSLLASISAEEVQSNNASSMAEPNAFNMSALSDEMMNSVQLDVNMEEKTELNSSGTISVVTSPKGSDGSVGFLNPNQIHIPSINVCHVPFFRGVQKTKLLHKDVDLQLHCPDLRIRFGLSTKFLDYAGRPRLNFVVEASPSLCGVLDACDDIAKKSFMDSGSSSEWRHVVMRRGYVNIPTVRLNIPTAVTGETAQYATEMYQKDSSAGTTQKLVFSKFDVEELGGLLKSGCCVDAYISLDLFDYQQTAGIRLVAKRLVVIHEEE